MGDFGIDIPNDVQFVGTPITVTGGTSCTVKITRNGVVQTGPAPLTPNAAILAEILSPAIVEASCVSDTGTPGSSNDVEVNFDVYVIDTLDGSVCVDEEELNTAKHVSIVQGASPSPTEPTSTVTFTTTIAVSDFVDVNKLFIKDVLDDGYTYQDDAQIIVSSGTYTLSRNITNNSPNNGETTIDFDILNSPSGTSGILLTDFDKSSTATITFTATIDETYFNLDQILANDTLTSDLDATYTLVQGAGVPPQANCTEDTSSSVLIHPVTVTKELLNPQPSYNPGDSVTFRLTMDIPSGDADNIVFEDFYPLPAFDVDDPRPIYGIDNNTTLTSNANISLGPAHTAGFLNPSNITVNGAQNKVSIAWPDLDQTGGAKVIQIDITSKVNDAAFSDGLILSNFFQGNYNNSITAFNDLIDLVEIDINAPNLTITKGVSAASNPSGAVGTIDPLPSFEPIDGDLSGVDAEDLVTYVITVENQGAGKAYNVRVKDPTPSRLDNCSILTITNGDLTDISGAETGNLFTTSGNPDNWLNLNTTLDPNDGDLGSPYSTDTALITVQCEIKATANVDNSNITNTASVSYTSTLDAAAEDFPTETDTAAVTVDLPIPSKSIEVTSEAHTSEAHADTPADRRPVAIGEIIRYRLVTTLPEGTYPNFRLRDQLPGGLQYLDDGTAKVAFVGDSAISTNNAALTACGTLVSAIPSVDPTCDITATNSSNNVFTPSSGGDPYFFVGRVTNNDDDANTEYIVVEFNAVVLDKLTSGNNANNHGNSRTNDMQVRSNQFTINFNSSNGPTVVVREPRLSIDKRVRISGVGSYVNNIMVDGGDEVEFRIRITSSTPPRTEAFDTIISDALPTGLTYVPASLTALSTWGANSCSVTGTTGIEALNVITFSNLTLAPSDRCQFTFKASLNITAPIGGNLTNTAKLDYSSLPANGTRPQRHRLDTNYRKNLYC